MLGSDEHKANDPTSLLQPPLSRDVMISGFCWFKDLMFSLWHDYPQGFFWRPWIFFLKQLSPQHPLAAPADARHQVYVRKRPGLEHFMATVSQLYEAHSDVAKV